VSLARTRNERTPYAVDMTGGGRNSAIKRKMSTNKFRGMATSAIWNATIAGIVGQRIKLETDRVRGDRHDSASI
jgi:hypothetical protein